MAVRRASSSRLISSHTPKKEAKGRINSKKAQRNIHTPSGLSFVVLLAMSNSAALKRVLFIPDCHIPYHDQRMWKLLLKVIAEFQPSNLVILGDFADFYAISDHDKNPNRVRQLEAEVSAVNRALDELDSFGFVSSKVFIKGNHEFRLERYLMRRAPELFNMVNTTQLFNLEVRGWTTIEYMDDIRIGKLYVTHDTGRCGKYAHIQSQADYETNVVIGHTHQIGYTVVGNAQGRPHVGAMFGWLGDFDKIDYMHRAKARRNWSHGLGLGYLEPHSGSVHLVPVPVVLDKVLIEGSIVRL